MTDKPKVGISRCLLGEHVRYDGGHKRDRYLTDILGPSVEWVGVCPEVECGLPVPRESMHLAGNTEAPRLVTIRSGIDHTERMDRWIAIRLGELAKENLCGYVFKSKSPSSGMRDIMIYTPEGNPSNRKSAGLFARAFMDRFPLIPVEDEGRLNDAALRENFIERIFIVKRWQDLLAGSLKLADFIHFHTIHKLLLMAHSPAKLRELGKLIASCDKSTYQNVMPDYFNLMMQTVKLIATVSKHVNVLQHILGYFKKQLSPDEKQEALELIEHYHQGHVPLIVPVTLLNHYTRKYHEPYLGEQIYLHPHPLELMLRNHS